VARVFEFDAAKSVANLAKHGIDFLAVQRLWDDEDLLELPVHFIIESRTLVIGIIDGKKWTAVITHRGPYIRIISVRRARTKEIWMYESKRL
jgi:uncharacterized DUF497 family protein